MSQRPRSSEQTELTSDTRWRFANAVEGDDRRAGTSSLKLRARDVTTSVHRLGMANGVGTSAQSMTVRTQGIVTALLCTVPAVAAVITLDCLLRSGYTRARLLIFLEGSRRLGSVGPHWWFSLGTIAFLFVLGIVSFAGWRRARRSNRLPASDA